MDEWMFMVEKVYLLPNLNGTFNIYEEESTIETYFKNAFLAILALSKQLFHIFALIYWNFLFGPNFYAVAAFHIGTRQNKQHNANCASNNKYFQSFKITKFQSQITRIISCIPE